jgi:hypothetical protein
MVNVFLTFKSPLLANDPQMSGWLKTVQASLENFVNEELIKFLDELQSRQGDGIHDRLVPHHP